MNSMIFQPRRVRSFVRRDRMTSAQQNAFTALWPRFGLSAEQKVDWQVVFQRDAVRVLEIGFGSGQSLFAMAKAWPDQDFVGIETHKPGIGALLQQMQQQEISNIRIFYADAVEVLGHCILPSSFDAVQIFFPDPWPKRRHHKRRLIQPPFVALLISILKLQGDLHLATDWEDYAKDMMQVLSANPALVNLAGVGQFSKRSTQRPLVTKFESRGQEAGRVIWELQFRHILNVQF